MTLWISGGGGRRQGGDWEGPGRTVEGDIHHIGQPERAGPGVCDDTIRTCRVVAFSIPVRENKSCGPP